MNFVALLAALVAERFLSRHAGVREPVWLIAYVRRALRGVGRDPHRREALAALAALLPSLVFLLLASIAGLHRNAVAEVVLSAVVLVFCLGPRDLRREVMEFRAAMAAGDTQGAGRLAAEILEHDAAQRAGESLSSVAEAVFVQANNRLFGVLFWFALAGPAGALAFRVSDLLRREALVRARRADAPAEVAQITHQCQRVHGVIAFLPARLLALTYGIAGSFEESFRGWRGYLATEADHFFDANDRLLVYAGRGALGARWDEALDEPERARLALSLADGALYVWVVLIALATLVGWLT